MARVFRNSSQEWDSPGVAAAPSGLGIRENGEACGVLPGVALKGLPEGGAPDPTVSLGEKPKNTCIELVGKRRCRQQLPIIDI